MQMDYSVIIPIFNAETTLRRCLDSLVDQSFDDYELLLINDGSTDGSDAICREYANVYPCIRYFAKENGGVSSARKLGLEQAKGEYILFVDSDDWIEPNMVEALVICAQQTHADIVRCGYYEEDGPQHLAFCSKAQTRCPDQNTLIVDLMNDGLMSGALWNKLYRHSALGETRFQNGYSEDILFNYLLLAKEPKVVYVSEAYYHYRVNNGSVTNSTFRPSAFSIIEVKKQIMDAQTDEQVKPYCLKGYLNSAMIVMNNMLSSGKCLEYYPGLRAEILKYKWTVWRSSLYGARDKAKMLLLALSAKLYRKAVPKK